MSVSIELAQRNLTTEPRASMNSNPFEPPDNQIQATDIFPQIPFDIGHALGCYSYFLATIAFAVIAYKMIVNNSLHIDLTFPFCFWAGHRLKKHCGTMRIWVLTLSFVYVLAMILAFGYLAITDSLHVDLRSLATGPWSPALGLSLLTCAGSVLKPFPFLLLLTPRAQREFSHQVAT